MVRAIQRGDRGLHITAAAQCREQLIASGYDCPEWGDVARGLRPGQLSVDDPRPGPARGGNEVWQRMSMKHSVQGLCGRDCTSTSRRSSVPKWPDGKCTIQFHPMVECDSVRTPGVPCVAPQTPLVPFTPVRVKLPVWPSTRSKWPPPRSLSARRSFGAKGVPFGECRSTCLQRGGGESDFERPSPGSGPALQEPDRRLEVADGLPLIRGAQLAIDTTMVSPVRMDGFCAPAMRNNRLPRTCSGSRSGTPGGGGLRSRRPVVRRGPFVPQLVGKR